MSDYSIDLHSKIDTVITDNHYRYTIKNGKDSVNLIIYVRSINCFVQKAAPIIIKVPSNISYNIVLDDCFINHHSLIDITALTELDASKVISMYRMFRGCGRLKDITPISSWDVSNVTNIREMFYKCLSLKNIMVLSNWMVLENCNVRYFYTIPDVSLEETYRYIFPEVNDIDAKIRNEERKSDSRTVWLEQVIPYRRMLYQNAYVKNNCPSWLVERYMKVHTFSERRMYYDYERIPSIYRTEFGDLLYKGYRDIIDYKIYEWRDN